MKKLNGLQAWAETINALFLRDPIAPVNESHPWLSENFSQSTFNSEKKNMHETYQDFNIIDIGHFVRDCVQVREETVHTITNMGGQNSHTSLERLVRQHLTPRVAAMPVEHPLEQLPISSYTPLYRLLALQGGLSGHLERVITLVTSHVLTECREDFESDKLVSLQDIS